MEVKAVMVAPGRLTPREVEVALRMAEGCSNKLTARLLAMSIRTVDTHTGHIIEKLGLHLDSLSDNAAGLNLRVRAVAVMVARGMIRLSINSVFAFMVLNSALLDVHAVRVRSGSSCSRVRRDGDV